MTGYSGTPLAAKLGIKAGMVMRAVHAPKEYRELLAPLPDGARVTAGARGRADIVHHFAKRSDELAKALSGYRRDLDVATPVWVSWPRKSAGVATDVTEDRLKLVVRRDRR